MASFPMGFTWSLYFAQVISETKIQKVPGLEDSRLISDRGEAVVFRAPSQPNTKEVRRYVNVDNLGIVSPHEGLVREGIRNMEDKFNSEGLMLRPSEVSGASVKALGSSLRGDILATRVTPKRFHRVRQSLRAILGRKKVSGKTLEVAIGHATFCALTNRQVLSVFHATYRFIRAEYYAPVQLWDSVSSEVTAFIGLMIFLHADWGRPWNTLVSASDASAGGYGVSTSYTGSKQSWQNADTPLSLPGSKRLEATPLERMR